MPEVTLQPAASEGVDTHISEVNPTTNYGTNTRMNVYYHTGGENQDALMKFDLSAIAPGSKIQVATLTLHVDGVISLALQADLWRILPANSGWTEGGVTWNTIDGSTSWAGAAGCETKGIDYSNSPLYEMTSDFVSGDNVFDLNVSEFQALIDVGNYGMILKGRGRNPTVSRGVQLVTSDEATDTGDRPELYVRWISPSGRLFEYTFNKYDPEKKVLNSMGRAVQPNEIRPNNWMFVEGTLLPTAKVFDSLVVDPRINYIVGISNDEDKKNVGIEFDRNQFADQVVKRLTRGV